MDSVVLVAVVNGVVVNDMGMSSIVDRYDGWILILRSTCVSATAAIFSHSLSCCY